MNHSPRELRNSRQFMAVAHALLSEGRSVRFRAHGWSMHPAIQDGDAITVEPVEPDAVRPGDVLVCRTRRGVTAHRVASIDRSREPRQLVLRGDAAAQPDHPIVDADILGRVVAVERNGRATRLSRAWSADGAAALVRAAAHRVLRSARR